MHKNESDTTNESKNEERQIQLRYLGCDLGKSLLGCEFRALTHDGVCDDVLVEDLNLMESTECTVSKQEGS